MKEWYQMTEQEVLERLQARPGGTDRHTGSAKAGRSGGKCAAGSEEEIRPAHFCGAVL